MLWSNWSRPLISCRCRCASCCSFRCNAFRSCTSEPSDWTSVSAMSVECLQCNEMPSRSLCWQGSTITSDRPASGDRARGRAGEGGFGSTGITLTWSISQIESGRLRQGAGGPPGKRPPRAHVLLLTILPGLKGVHIHDVGRCVPPFEPAGPHFNTAKAVRAVMSCARPEGPYDVLATLCQLLACVPFFF